MARVAVTIHPPRLRTIIAGTREDCTYERLYKAVRECGWEVAAVVCTPGNRLAQKLATNHRLPLEQGGGGEAIIATGTQARRALRAKGMRVHVFDAWVDDGESPVDPLTYAALVHGEL